MKKDNPEFLLKQIKTLQADLKKQSEAANKYKQALLESNERIQKITKNLEEGMSLLKGIHRNLIPVDLPNIPYFEFSYKFAPTLTGVSGDFFDVIKIKDSLKFAIIISNCNTYAITSLFLSSFLKSSQILHDCKNSKEFLLHAAKQLPECFSKDENISVFCGIVDRKDFSLDYCMVGDVLAGFQKQGEEYNLFKPCADNLITAKDSLKNEVVFLNPQDVLLLCSPGVARSQNTEGESFGVSNILEAAKNKKTDGVLGIRQNILFECDKFVNEADDLYDRTVLAIEVKKRVLKLKK